MVNVLENLAATARADDARRDKWAADRGLRPSKGTACLHWISKGRCSVGYCLAGLGSARWMDHMTAWIGSNGERVLICQPYHLGDDSRTSLAEACDRFDLEATIHDDGFYGYGTICIELRPRQHAGSSGAIGYGDGKITDITD